MILPTRNLQRSRALHRHLSINESRCIKHNIIVRVNEINPARSIAFCSVQQRLTGLFRRTYSVPELIWHGEEALAPFIELGITPLLTVRHKSLTAEPAATATPNRRTLLDRFDDLWRWLGYPFSREGFAAAPLVRDPFGWKHAMNSSGVK